MEKLESSHAAGRNAVNGVATLETTGQFLKMLKIVTIRPGNSAHRQIPNENICVHNLYFNVHSSIILTVPKWKQPKCPSPDN